MKQTKKFGVSRNAKSVSRLRCFSRQTTQNSIDIIQRSLLNCAPCVPLRLTCLLAYAPFSSSIGALRAFVLSCYKYHCVCRLYVQRHMQRCKFSILDGKHPFWANLPQKIKIVSLSWNLVPRLIQICKIQWWCFFFSIFDRKYIFWANLVQKIEIASLN